MRSRGQVERSREQEHCSNKRAHRESNYLHQQADRGGGFHMRTSVSDDLDFFPTERLSSEGGTAGKGKDNVQDVKSEPVTEAPTAHQMSFVFSTAPSAELVNTVRIQSHTD